MATNDDAKARLLRARARDGGLWVPVSGTSMGDRYANAIRVLVVPVDRTPRVGEVWAFYLRDATVAHRFLYRRGTRLTFAGDAMSWFDGPVSISQLVGRVTVVDDGERQWRPQPRHAVAPMLRHFYRAASRRVFRSPLAR